MVKDVSPLGVKVSNTVVQPKPSCWKLSLNSVGSQLEGYFDSEDLSVKLLMCCVDLGTD